MSWEGRTMRSRTSFFNPTVFLHDLRRYWPLTAGYTLIWLLALPVNFLTSWNHVGSHLAGSNMNFEALSVTAVGGCFSAFCAGILFAMAAFSYLGNTRATYGLHALPERRETLYLTHYLAGLCSQLAPQLLAALLTEAVLLSHRAADIRVLGLMLLSLVLPTLFFYSFGVFCMIFTGQLLAAPVFYGILNILAVGVEVLVRSFAGNFLYGWAGSDDPKLIALSPIIQLAETNVRAAYDYVTYTDAAGQLARKVDYSALRLYGLDWLLLYAGAGLVFAALGLLVYRLRHSEDTGSVVAIRWARPVFKYGVTFCAALALGQLLYYLFFGQYRYNGAYSLGGTLLCMGAAGLIGYFAAEMLLKKSFRVLRSGWRGAVTVTAVMAALGCAMTFDLTGYEGYLPGPEDVELAEVNFNAYSGNAHCFVQLRDPRSIQRLEEAHRAVIADKRRQQADLDDGGESAFDRGLTRCWFDVTYHLKNGDSVSRTYNNLAIFAAELGDPSSPAAALTALYNDPEVTTLRALGNDYFNWNSMDLRDLRFTGGYVSVSEWDEDAYLGDRDRDLTPAQAEDIYDAVLRDVAAGHAEASLFREESYERRYEVQLYASFAKPEGVVKPIPFTAPADEDPDRVSTTFTPQITESMTHTRAVLHGLGLFEKKSVSSD